MRKLTIARRVPNGWTPYEPNQSKDTCDWCNARLYVAPDGKTLYCDAMHHKRPVTVHGVSREHKIPVTVL